MPEPTVGMEVGAAGVAAMDAPALRAAAEAAKSAILRDAFIGK